MTIYEQLGVRRVINASATLTRLGGSLMPPSVVRAMSDAAGSFIDLTEFQRKVAERIANLTRNEAAFSGRMSISTRCSLMVRKQ